MKIKFMLLLGTLLLSVLSTFNHASMGSLALGEFARQPATEPFTSLSNAPNFFQVGYVDPDLLSSTGLSRVLIIASDSMPPNEIAKYMIASGATPSFKGFYVMVGVIHADNVELLASDPHIFAILKDRKVEYSVSTDFTITDFPSGRRDFFLLPLEKRSIDFRENALTSKPETTLKEIVNIIGARRAWTDLGINGTDVTIAIVDTGVDYGALGLGYWDVVSRDDMGYSAAFDADAQCMVITNTTVKATYTIEGRKYLNTSGIDPDVYFALGPWLGMPVVVKFSDLTGSPWPADMEITGITSSSGDYHFGIMIQWWNMVPGWLIMQIFPVLVVDSAKPRIYDTVYVDLSFDWSWLGWISSNYPEILPHWPGTWPPEFSFIDETPLAPSGWTVAARDFTGDEIYDLSAGSLGYFLDVWRVSPNAADRGLVLKPVDPAGNYTIFVNDWFGHGTYCASSAVGRDAGHPMAGPGIAPGAKVMGIVALWIGDIIEAELWAAGFDLIPGTEGWSDLIPGYGWVWGIWNYTGNHKADIISNSWGWSAWALGLQGLHWYDLLTILEDALMIPGYLTPDYPGTVVVHACGNGGPGYGTITSPGYATLPISVGASTSFETTALPFFGIGGGYFDDVISWSATGPTPQGNVMLDVVNVGAWAWVSGPVWSGLGEGWDAFRYFGGTSLATPLTSGSVALLIQGYAKTHEGKPTPEAAKVILKSTAKDLGYDVFLQGSGRVDCFAAVSLALKKSGVTVASPITWENVRTRIQYSWSAAGAFFGYPLQVSPPTGPINDTGWFAGAVRPSNSTSAEFIITNPTNDTITATITPLLHEQIGDTAIHYGETAPLEGWLEGYGDRFIMPMMPGGSELMVVTLAVPFSYFDPDGDYIWDRRFRIFILDWIDANGDGLIQPQEVFIVNYGYNTGTVCEARVGFPLSKFKGKPVVWVSQANRPQVPYAPVPYKVYVSYYKRDRWDWVTAPANISVEANSSESFTAKLMVPPRTPQGIYEGQMVFNVTAPYTRAIVIPVSLAVPMVLSPEDLVMDITPPAITELYDPYRVRGHFDWRWRYEAGDWKVWLIDIQDLSTVAAFISCNWTGEMTDIDMFVINPAEIIVGSAMSPYLGHGCFSWQTGTGTKSEYVASHTSNPVGSPVPGLYTILLHNVLFNGEIYPENVTGRVELVKLSPRGPVVLPIKPGKSASLTFTLTTGRRLTDIKIMAHPYTQFPVSISITPSTIPEISAMESSDFSATVTVPEDTCIGVYPVLIGISIPELMGPPMYMPVIVLLNVVADNIPPIISIVSPAEGEVIGRTMKVKVYAMDELDAVESVDCSIEGETYASMTFNVATGLWTASVDTTKLADGAYTLAVNATDRAGNSAIKKIAFTVDNTEPTAEIAVPSYLMGTATVNVTGIDPNFDRMEIYVGGKLVSIRTEPGVFPYTIDTTKLTDGSYLVKLHVYDKAGNIATSEVTVVIDNTMPLAEIRAPPEGATLGGTYQITVYGYDANLEKMELYIGATLAEMWTEVGTQTYAWNTITFPDGLQTIKLRVVDKAGNAVEKTLTVVVDNTNPSVSIESPAAGAELSGEVTITFSASDTNLELAQLIIDNMAFNVTGETSFTWNTTEVGDGSHSIRLIAYDKAGNKAETSITVITINTRLAVEWMLLISLGIGVLIGIMIGAVIAWALVKRRLKRIEIGRAPP